MKDKIDSAFRTALKLPDSVDLTEVEYHSTPGWDSVGHMALVALLEQEFDCMLDMDDILEMSNYEKVTSIMGKYA